MGSNLRINGKLRIYGRKGCIEIGDNVRINSCERANPIGGMDRMILFSAGGRIKISDGAAMSNSAIVSAESVTIGKNVFIGGNCKIYDTDFHSVDYEKRVSKHDDGIKTAPVTICDGAFIGGHSIILKGVTVGEKSVVGAGSVVTKSIPSGEIWAGNPAQFVRRIEV